jgi:hypothetical protein
MSQVWPNSMRVEDQRSLSGMLIRRGVTEFAPERIRERESVWCDAARSRRSMDQV